MPVFGTPSTVVGPVQPLGERSTIIGQRGREASCRVARLMLDPMDVRDGPIERLGHQLVHALRLVALDEVRGPAAAAEELVQLLGLDAGQHGRVADLVAIEVQDRQHGAVGDRIEKLVGLPGGRQRAGLRLAVADDTGDDQPRVVERGPEGVAERVAQLAAFVDRSRRRRRHMAADPAGKGELGEQPFQPGLVLADVRIDLAVGPFQIGIGDQRRATVAGAGDVEHVQVMRFDDPVQMHIDKILARCRAPVTEHHRLDVRERQRLFEQGVVVEIDLADRQIVGGTPVGVHLVEPFGREGGGSHGGVSWVDG